MIKFLEDWLLIHNFIKGEKVKTDIVVSESILEEFQAAIDLCEPAVSNARQTLQDSLTIANGIKHIKAFLNLPEVKELVIGLQDNVAGFLTDKSELAIKKHNAKPGGYKKKAYTYEEICEALVPCLMEGYRLTGNEINIISGKGMPVKAGKFRKITEHSGVSNFKHSIGTPHYDGNIAKMRCQATWMFGGELQSIGLTEEDKCVIAVEKGSYDGIDKLIGLADSKLFSRVLTRLLGKFVAEGDVSTTDVSQQKTQLPQSNKKLPNTPKQENPLLKEWDNLILTMDKDQFDTFERDCYCPMEFKDIPPADQPSRLNQLKTFLSK